MKTPRTAYRRRRRDIDQFLQLIARELVTHERERRAAPDSWQPAGQLGLVRMTLRQLLAYLGSREESDVERMLAAVPGNGQDDEDGVQGDPSALQAILSRLADALADQALAEAGEDDESTRWADLWRLTREAIDLAD